ncbi:hypothetical protein ACI1US_00983 [Leucobacter sp. BZR 635]
MATELNQEVARLVLAEMGKAEMSRASLSVASGIPLTTLRRKLDAVVGFNFEELYRVAGALSTTPSAFTPRAFVPSMEIAA